MTLPFRQEFHQSSPHRFAEPPFQGWLFRFAASRPVGSLATGNFNGKWWNDRFFESILPSHRYRGALPRESTCLTIFSFVPSAFWQLASLVPCMIDELTRPLRGHPFSTQKGGARLSFFLFPHVCLVRIVQDDDLRRPKAAEWSGSPLGELAPEASEGEERKMAGFIIFLPATVPILPICPVTPISPVQKFQDSRYPFGYMI